MVELFNKIFKNFSHFNVLLQWFLQQRKHRQKPVDSYRLINNERQRSIRELGKLLNLNHLSVFDIIKRYKKYHRFENYKKSYKLYEEIKCFILGNIKKIHN